MMFLFIIFGLPLATLGWWWWGDRRLARLGARRRWRVALGGFAVVHVTVYGALILSRVQPGLDLRVPPLVASAYIWHLVVLPMACVLAVAVSAAGIAVSRWGRRRARGERGVAARGTPGAWAAGAMSRRQWLAAAAVAGPPAVSMITTGRALATVQDFRVRRMDVPIAGLTPDLDGATIAHVSDIHVGRFTHGAVLKRITEATNSLRADLVLLTGDLIDFALSDLPAAVDCVRAMEARSGVYLCEGNHDLFENAGEFRSRVRRAGLNLLRNETALTRVRGVDVQVLGLAWGTRESIRRADVAAHARSVLAQRADGPFSIVLAHHPHAFDHTSAAGVPLTLAGHTHGGQLMLGSGLGAGPMMFKYWSGLYAREGRSLVVSNGVGNWFPLRTFAPAEIVHVTLRRA